MRLLTSWDDGHPCDLRLADLLDKHGLVGTFFVPARNREGRQVMSDAEIRHLDKRFEVGGHTMNHQYLLGLPRQQALTEIADGKSALEQILGHPVRGFCYPGGKFGPETARCVELAGFHYARTTENLRLEVGDNPFSMPTTLQFYPHGAAVLARNFLRRPAWPKIGILRSRAQSDSFWTFLQRLAESSAAGEGTFHLWGHSWEVEDNGLWQHLDASLAMLAGLCTGASSLADAAPPGPTINREVH